MIFTFHKGKKWRTWEFRIPGPRKLRKKWARKFLDNIKRDVIDFLSVRLYIIIYRPEKDQISIFFSISKRLYIFEIEKKRVNYYLTLKSDNIKTKPIKFFSLQKLVFFIRDTLYNSIYVSKRNSLILERARRN